LQPEPDVVKLPRYPEKQKMYEGSIDGIQKPEVPNLQSCKFLHGSSVPKFF
jgi:hypothetical protein